MTVKSQFKMPILTGVIALGVLMACQADHTTASPQTQTQENIQPMIIKKPSAYSASETIDRLETILNAKGLTVFTRVNHAAGAKSAGLEMSDSELIIFGNPKLGTPLMVESPEMGLDLPLKALAYSDASGQTYLSYTAPSTLSDRHGITVNSGVIEKMTGALDAMTSKAVSAQ
jgi:uncharacterized protein (DUF302 family)